MYMMVLFSIAQDDKKNSLFFLFILIY